MKNHFGGGFAYLYLSAHLLDLRCLLFVPRSKTCDCLLQLRDRCLLLLDFFVLFEELIEQHRVNGFVTHGLGVFRPCPG